MPERNDNESLGLTVVAPLAVTLVVVGPVIAVLMGATFADVFRAIVAAMTLVVCGLYVATAINILLQVRHMESGLVRQMAIGRAARIVASLLFMALGMDDLIQRFGHQSLAVFTPVLSACDLLLLVAWLLMDLRRWKETVL